MGMNEDYYDPHLAADNALVREKKEQLDTKRRAHQDAIYAAVRALNEKMNRNGHFGARMPCDWMKGYERDDSNAFIKNADLDKLRRVLVIDTEVRLYGGGRSAGGKTVMMQQARERMKINVTLDARRALESQVEKFKRLGLIFPSLQMEELPKEFKPKVRKDYWNVQSKKKWNK